MAHDVFESFDWHSSVGIDEALKESDVMVEMPWNIRTASMFTAAGGDLLVHKTTRCLWKMSRDKKTIEPVFDNDVLSEDEVMAAMGET